MENNPENNIPPQDLNGPMGIPAEPLPDSGGIQIQKPNPDKTVVCWNCLSVLIVRDEWNVVECSECHKLNRVPHEDFPGDTKISLHESEFNDSTYQIETLQIDIYIIGI